MLLVLSLVPTLENMPTIQSLKMAELNEAIPCLGRRGSSQVGSDGASCPLTRAGGATRHSPSDRTQPHQECAGGVLPEGAPDPTEWQRDHSPVEQEGHGPRLPDCRAEWAGLGFGKYASLSYEEVMMSDLGYCNWALTIFHEEDKSAVEVCTMVRKDQGAHPDTEVVATAGTVGDSTQDPPETQALTQIMSALTDLNEEVEAMEEERPHKKKDNSSEDFSMVSGPQP